MYLFWYLFESFWWFHESFINLCLIYYVTYTYNRATKILTFRGFNDSAMTWAVNLPICQSADLPLSSVEIAL